MQLMQLTKLDTHLHTTAVNVVISINAVNTVNQANSLSCSVSAM